MRRADVWNVSNVQAGRLEGPDGGRRPIVLGPREQTFRSVQRDETTLRHDRPTLPQTQTEPRTQSGQGGELQEQHLHLGSGRISLGCQGNKNRTQARGPAGHAMGSVDLCLKSERPMERPWDSEASF